VQAELNVEQWEQSPGSEVYTFSHPEGSHDDRFWAICMAVYASMQAPPLGKGAVMLPHQGILMTFEQRFHIRRKKKKKLKQG
jgi:hypothetical protein